jgi:hypothetical protein
LKSSGHAIFSHLHLTRLQQAYLVQQTTGAYDFVVATHVARSLGEYFSTVSMFRHHWNTPADKELWFRAEDAKHQETRLQPGLYRPPKTEERKPIPTLLKLENDLYEEFIRCAPQLSDTKLSEDEWEWDAYFLMQHHGVPTRILDWSDGALIALHFAAREKAVPPATGSIIYVLDPDSLALHLRKLPEREDLEFRWKEFSKSDPSRFYDDDWGRLYLPCDEDDWKNPLLATPEIPMLDDAPHINRRFAAQRSRFMVFGSDPLWISNWAQKQDSRFEEISIPVDAITPIQQELRDAGITESVIYPDLDGLGRELKQIWRTRI